MSKIKGLELPFGIKPIEATPVDAWFGPYTSTIDAIESIPKPIRYITMQVGITGDSDGSKIYWFKNGINDDDLIPMIDDELLKMVTGETESRINQNILLFNQITEETKNRIDSDNVLLYKFNEISGTVLNNYYELTGETKNRQDADNLINHQIITLNNQITGLTDEFEKSIDLFNKEVTARDVADNQLQTQINDTNLRIDYTETEIESVRTEISGSSGYFYNLLTGETSERKLKDVQLDNKINDVIDNLSITNQNILIKYNVLDGKIFDEEQGRISSDLALSQTDELLQNQINDLNDDLVDLNSVVSTNFNSNKNLILTETSNRIIADSNLYNQITGETANRISGDTNLHNEITGETKNRQNSDLVLTNQITALTQNVNNNYNSLTDLIDDETINRINSDNNLTNRINSVENLIGVISGDTSLYNMLTGETANRISGDTNLYNQITGLSETLNNNLIVTLSEHTGDTNVHLTPFQNTFLDNITGITSTEVNYLYGLTGNTQQQLDNKSNLNHHHYSLYDQSGTTEILYIDAGKNIHITGDLLVSGTTYETHAETLYIKDSYIYLRDGATAGLTNGNYTGIEAVKYNGVNNGRLVFDYLGVARVGDVGNEQPLLTRNESSEMVDGYLTIWDETNHRVNTIDPMLLPSSTETLTNITNEINARISGDTNLHNEITGETKNRQDSDLILTNQITGITSIINLHTEDTNVHLTPFQNTFLDNITGITSTEVNYLYGLTGNTQQQLDNKSNLNHHHSSLYHPSGTTEIIYVDLAGNIHVDGNIYQTGSTYSTHTEQVLSKNDYIILRDGATTGLDNGAYTGIEAVKYDSINNGRLVFDNNGIARVGDVGFEQPLATRSESNEMTDNAFVFWSNDEQKFKTSNYLIDSISTEFVNISGDTMTGSLTSTAFIKQGGVSSEFLKADGSIDNTTYQEQLPLSPENPKSYFLNGEKKWSEIALGGKGYTTNFYLSDDDSDVVGYKKITTIYNPIETLKTITVRNDLGEVFSESYLFDEMIETDHIDEGVWANAIGGMVSSSLDNTRFKYECFVRKNSGNEIILFTGYSETFESTSQLERIYSETKIQTITVETTDRIGVKIYGVTDADTIRTITYCVGGINSTYFNTPMFIRHTELRGLNDDNNFLHLTLNEKNAIVTTGRTVNVGNGLIGGGNLSSDITLSHGNTSDVQNLSAIANFNGTVVQNISIDFDQFGHTTGHTVYNYDLDNRYYTENESDQRFVNITGDTIDGNLNVNDINVTSITYRSGDTINNNPGVRKLNTKIGTTEYKLIGHDITLQDGFEMLGWGYNGTSSIIPNGCPVTTSGNTIGITDAISIIPAIASDDENTLYRVIGVTTENIQPYSYGVFNIIGEIHDLNLSGFTNGDDVFLSQTEFGKLVKKEELSINGRVTEIGRVLDNSSTNGVLFVKIKNEFGVSNNTQLELENFAANNISTGAFYCEGITIPSTTGITFNVGKIKGWIADNETNPIKPKIKYVEFTGATGLTTPYLNTNTITYILLKNDGTLFYAPNFPTPIERREMIFIGNVGHANKTNISTGVNNIDIMISPFSQVRDFLSIIPVVNDGIHVSANGSNLNINTSGGRLYSFGINFHNNSKDPTRLFISGSTQSWFAYRTYTGGTSNLVQNVDPSHYDSNGIVTSLGNNKYTNQRVYILRSGELRLQYGQTIYQTIEDAINAIATESFTTFEGLRNDGVLIGIVTLKSNAVDLSNPLEARFTQVSRFGEVAGAAGGISVSTLQSTYNNSGEPKIKTNSVIGSFTIAQGSGNDYDKVLEIQNGSNITTAVINGLGGITGKTFTVSGGNSTQFLKADGSLDSNNYLTSDNSGHTHEDLYYDKIISDSRFVHLTGDTLSGDFRITGATPINKATILIQDITGGAILKGFNTGDQDLSGLATYNYVDLTFSPKSHLHTGVYQPIMNDNENYVTDEEKIKLSNLSGINTGDQDLSGYLTISASTTLYSPTSHTHDDRYYTKSQSESRYINSTGDTVNGELIATKFTKINGAANEFLMADGSSNNNKYYTQNESELKFVNSSGDTINGTLNIIGDLSVTNITGGTILSGINTGDQDLSDLATYDYVDTNFSLKNHKHYNLYTPDGNNEVVYTDNGGSFHVKGDLYVSGSTYNTNTETVVVSDSYIVLRDGALSGLANGEYSGLEFTKYDGLNNGRLVVDNSGTARVGDVGFEKPIVTRDETNDMLDGNLVYWSANDMGIKTTNDKFLNLTGGTVNGNIISHSFIKSGYTDDYLLLAGGGIVAKTEFQVSLGPDQNYVTDEEKIKLSNLSGINTGDQDLSDLATYDYVDDTFLHLTGGSISGILLISNETDTSGLSTGSIITYGGLSVSKNVYVGGNITATTFNGSLNGNSTSASKLANGRTIWGQSFDGLLNVTGNMTGVGSISASGKLTISNGGISVTGVSKTENIFTDVTGGTVLKGVNTGDQDLSGLATYDYVNQTFSTTGHTHINEYDLRYVNVTGDTITGTLTSSSFIKQGGSSNQFLKADGSVDSTVYAISGHEHEDLYYNKTISDSRFINITGDSMSGKLTISSGGISVTGVSKTESIFTDVTGGTVLKGVNTGDQDLSGLATYDYVNQNTLFKTGGTMTGTLYVNNTTNSTNTTSGAIRTSGGLGVVGNAYFGGTVTAPTFVGNLTGNAYSSSILENARLLWGQQFNASGNVTGNMTGVGSISASGKLTISSGGISVTGVSKTENIFTDLTGGTVLKGVNTGDQDLSGLATYDYVNQNTLFKTGGTINGSLTLNGQLFENSLSITNVSTSTNIYSISKNIADAAFIDYRVFNNSTRAIRAGTLFITWDSTNNTITYTDTSTPDLNSTTNSIKLYANINGNNIEILTTIMSGIWNIKLGVRLI